MTEHDDRNGETTRRTFLQTAAGAVALGGVAGAVGAQQEGPQLIVFDGRTPGWRGRAPGSIQGETNPTLPLVAGQDYRVRWTNVDGQPHNFAVLNANGDELVGTEVIGSEGATQTLEFTATENMAEYYCEVHPTSMRGGVEIVEESQLEPVNQTTTQPEQQPQGAQNDSEQVGVDVAQPIGVGNDTTANNTSQLQQFQQRRLQLFNQTGNGTVRGNLTYGTNETVTGTQTTNGTEASQSGDISAGDIRQATSVPGFGVLTALGGLLGGAALLSKRSDD